MSAIAATGSMLVLDVRADRGDDRDRQSARSARSSSMARASASGRMRKSPSAGILRSASWPRPSRMTALSTDECAWSEQ